MTIDGPAGPPANTETALEQALTRLLGTAVGGLRRLSAGASRETWALDAGEQALILRRDPPESPDSAGMAREADCFLACRRAEIPVPRLIAHGDGSDGVGSPYLLMERLEGESLPQRLLRDDRWAAVRPKLTSEFGEILARIHDVPTDEVPLLEASDEPLTWLGDTHAGFGEPRPAMELILRRLASTQPPPVAPSLVHGDFRNGNIMVDDAGVRAVLDWELAHIGDPREDLGWVCARAWRFGRAAEVGGFGSKEELLTSYARASGSEPDRAAVDWWEAVACARWAVFCRIQAERHLSGQEQSVELAVIGRRVAEAEFDALVALGLATPVNVDDPMHAEQAEGSLGGYGRPTVDELLAAVSGFLREELTVGDERSAYLAKVAANALTIARRQLRAGFEHSAAHHDRLSELGCDSDAELASGIREGRLSDRDERVLAAVRSSIIAQVTVANPRYLSPGR